MRNKLFYVCFVTFTSTLMLNSALADEDDQKKSVSGLKKREHRHVVEDPTPVVSLFTDVGIVQRVNFGAAYFFTPHIRGGIAGGTNSIASYGKGEYYSAFAIYDLPSNVYAEVSVGYQYFEFSNQSSSSIGGPGQPSFSAKIYDSIKTVYLEPSLGYRYFTGFFELSSEIGYVLPVSKVKTTFEVVEGDRAAYEVSKKLTPATGTTPESGSYIYRALNSGGFTLTFLKLGVNL